MVNLTGTDWSKVLGYKELKFLFGTYLETREKERFSRPIDEEYAGSLDLSRLEMVKQWGSSTLAYDSMAKQFQILSIEGVSGYLAYIVHEGTALMVGDPVTDAPQKLVREFVHFCLDRGLSPCAAQVSEAVAIVLREAGLAVNGFGIETFINLNGIAPELTGKKYEMMRSYQNIALRHGITVKEESIGAINRAVLQSVSAKWKEENKNKDGLRVLVRPATFTTEPGVRTFFLWQGERLLGYIFFSPIYRLGKVIGYYSDIEQFTTESTDIPSKFNFVKYGNFQAALAFRSEGVEFVSLGLSPLHNLGSARWNDNQELRELFEKFYSESILYAFQGTAVQKERFPDIIEQPVYFAAQSGTTGEDLFHIMSAVGFLG